MRCLSSDLYRIDIHQHIVPDFYASALMASGISAGFGVPFPRWSLDRHLRMMDRFRIASAVVSISTPGVYFVNHVFSRRLCRRCNEYVAAMIADHPGRFGGFASLPLPDVEGSLTELEYALDSLQLDGVVLLTNVDGHYPSDPSYAEIFQEMNRRKVVVYLHPHELPDEGLPAALANTLSPLLDTTRCVAGMLEAGMLQRYGDLRIILSHAGGIVPFLAERIASACCSSGAERISESAAISAKDGSQCQRQMIELLRSLYCDTIVSAGNHAFRSLQAFAKPSHLLLGSDYAWFPERLIPMRFKALQRYPGFNQQALADIERNNALALFPRLKG